MASCLRISLLLAASAVVLSKPLVARAKDWDKVDWDEAERDLEEGDDPELLLSEDAVAIKELEKRKQAGVVLPDDDVKLKDPTEWVRHTNAMSGPTMQFVTLKDSTSPDGRPWAGQGKKVLEELTGRWKELLKTAGIDAMCYDIGEGRVLVSLHTGWRGYDLRDFLLEQPEVEELEWDSVKYRPGEALPARPSDLQAAPGTGAGMPGGAPGGPHGGVPFKVEAPSGAQKKAKSGKAKAKAKGAAKTEPKPEL